MKIWNIELRANKQYAVNVEEYILYSININKVFTIEEYYVKIKE